MRPHGLVASDASLDRQTRGYDVSRPRRRATDTRRSRPPRPPAGDPPPRPPRRTRAAALLNGRRERLGAAGFHSQVERIEGDEIDGLALDVLAKDREAIRVVELVHPTGNSS